MSTINFISTYQAISTQGDIQPASIAEKIREWVRSNFETSDMESLFHIDRLSEHLIRSSPLSRKIWPLLRRDIKELFRKLNPYTLPPNVSDLYALHVGYRSLVRPQRAVYRLGDHSLIEALFVKEQDHRLIFTLPDHPGVLLHVSGPKSDAQWEELPTGIEDFFKIPLRESLPPETNLAAELAPQYRHQVQIIKKIYQQMVLEALGAPANIPLAHGTSGEWTIDTSEETKTLATFLKEIPPLDKLSLAVKQIARFLILEQKTGLCLMDEPQQLRIKGDQLYLDRPAYPLNFIEGSIAKWQQIFRRRLLEIPHAHEMSVDLDTLLKKEILPTYSNKLLKNLSPQDSLEGTPAAILSLRAASFPERQTSNLESIYHLCSCLLSNVPSKNRPSPLQIGTSCHLVIQQEREILNDLLSLILKYIIENSTDDYQQAFDTLITRVNHRLDNDPNLADIPFDGKPSLSAYFDPYWEIICGLLNKLLINELDIFETLQLLRAASLSGVSASVIEKKIQDITHQHLLAYNQHKACQKVRAAVHNLISLKK